MPQFPFVAFFAVAAAASTVTTATGPALSLRLTQLVVGVCQMRPDTAREARFQVKHNPVKPTKSTTKIKKALL